MNNKESIIFDALVDRIRELKAQLPKTVYPVYTHGYYECPECELRPLNKLWRYCPACGGKLNWEKEK